jgi:hypothetical protein
MWTSTQLLLFSKSRRPEKKGIYPLTLKAYYLLYQSVGNCFETPYWLRTFSPYLSTLTCQFLLSCFCSDPISPHFPAQPFQSWRWRHYASPKRWYLPTSLHDVRTQNNIVMLLVQKFSWLEFKVRLRLLGMSRVECWKLSNVLANIAVAIFRVSMWWSGVFWKLYIGQAVGRDLNLMVLSGQPDKISWECSMHMKVDKHQNFVRKGGYQLEIWE